MILARFPDKWAHLSSASSEGDGTPLASTNPYRVCNASNSYTVQIFVYSEDYSLLSMLFDPHVTWGSNIAGRSVAVTNHSRFDQSACLQVGKRGVWLDRANWEVWREWGLHNSIDFSMTLTLTHTRKNNAEATHRKWGVKGRGNVRRIH